MKPVPTWFIAVCWVLAVGFCICAGLQYNDPDPIRWMAIYGLAAIALGLLPARRIVAAFTLGIGLIATVWGAYLGHQVIHVLYVSDLWMKMSEKGGAVEVGREASGLAIISVTLLAASAFRVTRT